MTDRAESSAASERGFSLKLAGLLQSEGGEIWEVEMQLTERQETDACKPAVHVPD